jgi:hypothetical protein
VPHSKRPPRKAGAEYRFKIDAFTPETLPMARLAEYLRELAMILGERASVHLVRLEEGSTVLVHKIEREAVPKVRARTIAVRRGDAPRDAVSAFRTVNRFLREDNAVGLLQERKGATPILRFPGREEAEEQFPSVRQRGTIDGVVMRVGGIDETVPVLLESEGQQIAGCNTTRQIAKELAHRLFEPVRLVGNGRWSRDAEGVWTLADFRIEGFEVLQDAQLSTALKKLRAIGAEWGSDAYEELAAIRHGSPETADGRR